MNDKAQQKPDAVSRLESAYGGPSRAGFGSAVFHEPAGGAGDLTQAAFAVYKAFVGTLWERFGEQAWTGAWQEVYQRQAGTKPDIEAELRGIAGPDARLSVPMVLDTIDGAEAARGALSAVFDDPAVTELRVFKIGDGGAMSGLLVAGRRGAGGSATFLVFLLD